MHGNDVARELHKVLDTLGAVELFLRRHAEANAALHCNPHVHHSPLHAQVLTAMDGVQDTIDRLAEEAAP